VIIIPGNKGKYWIGILASLFLGVTFMVAGMGKWFAGVVEFELLAYPGFLPIPLAELLFISLVWVELIIGIVLVAGIAVKFVTSLSLSLIIGFFINNILLIVKGMGGEPCHCFGLGNRMSVITSLYLDGVMLALAITILVCFRDKFFNKRPWYWG